MSTSALTELSTNSSIDLNQDNQVREAKSKLISIEKEMIKRKARGGDLLAFTLYTKQDYQVNWHHKEVSKVLNRFIKGEITRLIIKMPPRHGKSELVSLRLPALLHGLYPNDEIMAASYSLGLASTMTRNIQMIMDTPEYREIFPNSRITPEGKVTKYPRNSEEHMLLPIPLSNGRFEYPKGKYRGQGVGGSFSGKGANWLIIDDPIKNREEADSEVSRDAVWNFYTSTLRTRLEGIGRIVVIMTPWHEDDFVARLIKQMSDPNADQYVVVTFPAIRDSLTQSEHYHDPREIGEPLWKEKFDSKALEAIKATSTRDWYSLYQQTPIAEGGNYIKRHYLKFYKTLPSRFDIMIQSWDFAVKDKSTSDYTVGTVWGRVDVDKFLIDWVRGQWDFLTCCNKLIELSKKYPLAYKKLIEDKANGPAIKQTLDRTVSGIVAVEPRGDKKARVHAIEPEFASGHVWFPHPDIKPNIEEMIYELCGFDRVKYDDQVDSVVQALDELRKFQTVYSPSSGHGAGIVF